MAANLEFKGKQLDEAARQIQRLYDLFLKVDATQVEINPFGETPDGQGNRLSLFDYLCWGLVYTGLILFTGPFVKVSK